MLFFNYFQIFKEKPGIISPGPAWICLYDKYSDVYYDSYNYMHIDESLIKLIYSVITEFKHDKHLVGY